MKPQNIFSDIVLYGRSTWQIVRSRLRPKQGIEDILNYRYISDKIATSGQPTSAELALIIPNQVINASDNALKIKP